MESPITLDNIKGQIKGIIFDMDGTMIDNMMTHHRAWQRKLEKLGLKMTLEEVKESIHGVNEEILLRLFGDKYTDAERAQIAWEKEEEYRNIFKNELKLVEGLPEFLADLKAAKIPLAIGTAAPPENVDFVLDNLNLRSYFQAVFHSKDVKKGKPNPEIFQKAAGGLNLDPKECLVFEDSVSGIQTALNAGSPAIAVTTTHGPEEFQHFPHVIKMINTFKEVKIADFFEV